MRRSSNRAGAGARSTRGARGNPDRRQGVRIEPTRRKPPSARVVSTSAAPPTRPTPSRARRRPSLPRVSCRRASEASRFARPRYHGEASPARGRRPRRTVGGGTVTRPAASGARGADRRGVRSPPCRCARARDQPSSRTLAPESDPADDCETPLEAYRHVAPALAKLAQRLKIPQIRAPRLGSLLLRGRRRAPSLLPRFPERT